MVLEILSRKGTPLLIPPYFRTVYEPDEYVSKKLIQALI
jgi:hypothetical protein